MYQEKSSATPNNESAQMQDTAKRKPEHFFVWNCHNCGLQAYMSVKLDEYCVDCGHRRCRYCDTEHHKRSCRLCDSSKISSPTVDQSGHPKELEIVPSELLSGAHKKSRGTTTDRSNNGRENSRNKSSSKKRKADDGNPVRLFACPFQKIDPMNHGLSVIAERQLKYRACICPGFVIHRLVQHLHEVHKHYDLVKSIKQSIKERAHCVLGGDEEREKAKWLVIWETLFPGVSAPKSPFNDPVYLPPDLERASSTFERLMMPMLNGENLQGDVAHRIYVFAQVAFRKAFELETNNLKRLENFGPLPLGFENSKSKPLDYSNNISTTLPPREGPTLSCSLTQMPLQESDQARHYQFTEPMAGPAIVPCTPNTGHTYAAAYQPEPIIYSGHSWASIMPTSLVSHAPDVDCMNSWTPFPPPIFPAPDYPDPYLNLLGHWIPQPTTIPVSLDPHDQSMTFSNPNVDQENATIPKFLPATIDSQEFLEQQIHQNQYDLYPYFGSEVETAATGAIPLNQTQSMQGDFWFDDPLTARFVSEGELTNWMAPMKYSYDRNRGLQGGGQGIQP